MMLSAQDMAGRGSIGKVAFALLLDVSEPMTSDSPGCDRTCFMRAIYCASRIILRQIFSGEMNEISVITFGSDETNNDLACNRENYQNISVLTPLKVASWEILEDVNKLGPSSIKKSKWTEAIIVALDTLRNGTQNRKFGSIQIVLISNFSQKLKFTDDNLDTLVNVMNQDNVKLVVMGYDRVKQECGSQLPSSMDIINKLARRLNTCALKSFDEAEDELKYYIKKRKNPRQLPIFLEIGTDIKIPVLWIKLNQESQRVTNIWRPASFDSEQGQSPVSKSKASFDNERGGSSVSKSNQNIPNYSMVTDESKTAFYGATKVTLSYADLEALKRKDCSATFTLIGCTRRKNISPLMYVCRDLYVVRAKPGDKMSYTMLSSFVEALIAAKKVGIAKRVLIKNSRIRIGALIPLSDHLGKHLYFLQLPMAEWLRPIPNIYQPMPTDDEAKFAAVDKFIDSRLLPPDLLEKDRGVLLPNVTFQSQCHLLAQSLMDKDKLHGKETDDANSLPDFITRILDPVPHLNECAEQALADITELFPPPVIEKNKFVKRKRINKDMNNDIELDEEEDVKHSKAERENDDALQKLRQELDEDRELVNKAILEAREKIVANKDLEMSTQSLLDTF